MDEFKKYLFDHRDELDMEKPPRPQVWMHIQRETKVVKKPVISLSIKWAAAILVAVSILIYQLQRPEKADPNQLSGITSNKTNNNPEPVSQVDSSSGTAFTQQNEQPIKEPPGKKMTPRKATGPSRHSLAQKEKSSRPIRPVSPLKAIENNYATIINYQVKKLESTPIYTESPGYFHVFKKQWLDLERDEKKVKQDVTLYGLNDNVVDKLIQLYQQKLWLLKELQSEINKMNTRAKQHPDIQNTNPAFLKL